MDFKEEMFKPAMDFKEEMFSNSRIDTAQPKITAYVGTFIVFDTQQVKGLRINLDKIRTYAMNGLDSIQVSYDGAGNAILKFATEQQAQDALARLDSFCL